MFRLFRLIRKAYQLFSAVRKLDVQVLKKHYDRLKHEKTTLRKTHGQNAWVARPSSRPAGRVDPDASISRLLLPAF